MRMRVTVCKVLGTVAGNGGRSVAVVTVGRSIRDHSYDSKDPQGDHQEVDCSKEPLCS